jgi:hypothetical protein
MIENDKGNRKVIGRIGRIQRWVADDPAGQMIPNSGGKSQSILRGQGEVREYAVTVELCIAASDYQSGERDSEIERLPTTHVEHPEAVVAARYGWIDFRIQRIERDPQRQHRRVDRYVVADRECRKLLTEVLQANRRAVEAVGWDRAKVDGVQWIQRTVSINHGLT